MTNAYWWYFGLQGTSSSQKTPSTLTNKFWLNFQNLNEFMGTTNSEGTNFPSDWNRHHNPKFWEILQTNNLAQSWELGILTLLSIYFFILILNIILNFWKKGARKLGMIRCVYTHFIVLPVTLLSIVRTSKSVKIDSSKPPNVGTSVLILSAVIIIADILISFSSPIIKKTTFLANMFPQEVCSFHVYSPRLFRNLADLKA